MWISRVGDICVGMPRNDTLKKQVEEGAQETTRAWVEMGIKMKVDGFIVT